MIRNNKVPDIEIELKGGNVLIASDFHVPFQDNKAVAAFKNIVEIEQPDIVVIAGDLVDMYMLSRFTKGEGRNPMEEIHEARDILREIRESFRGDMYYVIGNHEQRLEKNILTKAPEMASLLPDIFTLFKLEELQIKGCGSITINNNFFIKHGNLLGNKSGLSAIKEMENSYMSGASGHTHRLSKYIARKSGRKFIWMETGCLCSMQPEYMLNPNWQQGYASIVFGLDGKVKTSQVHEIEDGKVIN